MFTEEYKGKVLSFLLYYFQLRLFFFSFHSFVVVLVVVEFSTSAVKVLLDRGLGAVFDVPPLTAHFTSPGTLHSKMGSRDQYRSYKCC